MSTSSTCRVVLLSRSGVSVVGADGSGAQRPGEGQHWGSALSVRWSPDGERIALWKMGDPSPRMHREVVLGQRSPFYSGVSVADLRSGEVRDLTSEAGLSGLHPCWHPDGRRVTFAAGGELWSADADGGGLERLLETELVLREPTWSPDASRILFLALSPEANVLTMRLEPGVDYGTYLHVADADGSNQRRLSRVHGYFGCRTLSWSPDSERIAFAHERSLHLINADGSGRTQLTQAQGRVEEPWENSEGRRQAGEVCDGAPAWSPGGHEIAFVSTRSGCNQIYTIRPDGTRLTQLTHELRGDFAPAWSRDGSKIAFVSTREYEGRPCYGKYETVWLMDADGGNQQCVSRGQKPCDQFDIC